MAFPVEISAIAEGTSARATFEVRTHFTWQILGCANEPIVLHAWRSANCAFNTDLHLPAKIYVGHEHSQSVLQWFDLTKHFVCATQADFKSELAGTLGGGDAIAADDIIIESITAGSVTVAWYVEVPPVIMADVASLVTTLAQNTAAISVTVAGEAVVASEIAQPVVYAEPDVDCIGAFTSCDSSCTKYFDITTPASGSGAACDYDYYEEQVCDAGIDACPAATDIVQKASSGEIVACKMVTLGAILVSMMLSTLV